MIAVDNLLNETDLEVVVYTGQLDLIVDTLGQSLTDSHNLALHNAALSVSLCLNIGTEAKRCTSSNTPTTGFPLTSKTWKTLGRLLEFLT